MLLNVVIIPIRIKNEKKKINFARKEHRWSIINIGHTSRHRVLEKKEKNKRKGIKKNEIVSRIL